jgi:hypothetical protein
MRRFRLYRGVFQIYMFGIFLPLLVIPAAGRPFLVLRGATWLITLLALSLVFAERRRATKFVRAKTNITAAQASAILTTPTWRVSTWRRPPVSSLLAAPRHTPHGANTTLDAGNPPLPTERPTEL